MSLLQHFMKLSTLIQQHITSICSCGDITVTVTVTNCTNKISVYDIQLTGITATEAALSLIMDMESLSDGLDLGIVVLFLQQQGSFLQPNCNDQNKDISSEIMAVIGTLSVIVAMVMILVIFLLIFVIYLR